MPAAFAPELRAKAIEKIIAGLSAGTPLTVICAEDGMPADRTVREWMETDAELSAAIAGARERGFDQIALDALAIADAATHDTIETAKGPMPDKEWIMRSKLRVETRLKLLAKWDPKRYGELIKHGNADGSNIDMAAAIMDGNKRVEG